MNDVIPVSDYEKETSMQHSFPRQRVVDFIPQKLRLGGVADQPLVYE